MARPRPVVPPVTSARFPASKPMIPPVVRWSSLDCIVRAAGMPGPRPLLGLGTVLMSAPGREDRLMPGPGEPSAPVIGRDAGLARLRGLVDPVPSSGQVLLVTGEAGMGKSVLLADAAGRARAAGMRVLAVTGRESESKLAFAGLHQLLRPVLPAVAGL